MGLLASMNEAGNSVWKIYCKLPSYKRAPNAAETKQNKLHTAAESLFVVQVGIYRI